METIAFAAGLSQETNVFSPLPTGIAEFCGRFAVPGKHSADTPPFPESLLIGGRRRAEEGLLTLYEGPMAGAHPGGIVTRAAYESLRDAILVALRAALPVDLVALHLHGAMIADGYDDCEGDLLARVRDLAGPTCAIGAMIDPHAHVSPAMVDACDILIAYKEYPHTDFRERAEEVWDLLIATRAGRVRPVAALWDSGTIGIFHTSLPEVRALVDRMEALERSGAALSVSLIHSFPWGDGADFGTRALAICDDDPAAADAIAREIATRAGEIARATRSHGLSLSDALAHVAAADEGARPFVLADRADNPGGGAASDSTFVLAALIDRGIGNACLGPIWDPQAVTIAFSAGIGARLALRIGGKTGPLSGLPIDLDVEIIALDPAATQCFAGEPFPLGRAASVRGAGIDMILVSERDQARGPDMFTRLGITLADKRIVVVKSSQHFYDGFAPIAREILYLDGPGSLQSDLTQYPYQRIALPRWPMTAQGADPGRVPLTRAVPSIKA